MKWYQKNILLSEKKRGFHVITDEIIKNIPEIKEITTGLTNIFIQHTSASLSINEKADPDVREDFETHFNLMVPEDEDNYKHKDEGLDDMTSHIKASLLGSHLTIPVTNGELNLGTWQGIYLCEHRNHGGRRKLVVTVLGTSDKP